MKSLVELSGVSAGYDRRTVFREANLTIREEDFIGIVGPNGGGKTTLLKVVLGLLKPYSGQVTYHTSPRQSLFGYLPQNGQFDTRFPICVEEVVLSGLLSRKGLLKRYTRQDRVQANELLTAYGMGGYANALIGELSGGQMQRVFLCRAIISSPRLLILDEPATYVDSQFEKEFYIILEGLNKQMSVVMVSHDLDAMTTYIKTLVRVDRGVVTVEETKTGEKP